LADKNLDVRVLDAIKIYQQEWKRADSPRESCLWLKRKYNAKDSGVGKVLNYMFRFIVGLLGAVMPRYNSSRLSFWK
jgi:hypothetical protein